MKISKNTKKTLLIAGIALALSMLISWGMSPLSQRGLPRPGETKVLDISQFEGVIYDASNIEPRNTPIIKANVPLEEALGWGKDASLSYGSMMIRDSGVKDYSEYNFGIHIWKSYPSIPGTIMYFFYEIHDFQNVAYFSDKGELVFKYVSEMPNIWISILIVMVIWAVVFGIIKFLISVSRTFKGGEIGT